MDLALNNLQCLLCHKTKRNETKPNRTISTFLKGYIYIYIYNVIINKYILVYIYISLHAYLSATTAFMPSLSDNHQAEMLIKKIMNLVV